LRSGENVGSPSDVDLIGIPPERSRGDKCCKMHNGVVTLRRGEDRIGVSNVAEDVDASGVAWSSLETGDLIATTR